MKCVHSIRIKVLVFQDSKEGQPEVFLFEEPRELLVVQFKRFVESLNERSEMVGVNLFQMTDQIGDDPQKLQLSVEESNLLVEALSFVPLDLKQVEFVFRDVHQEELLAMKEQILR